MSIGLGNVQRTCAAMVLALVCAAMAGAGAPVTYKTGGQFFEGCFGPCHCIVTYLAPFNGTFRLQPEKLTGKVDTFAVNDLNLEAMMWNDPGLAFTITGSGTYTYISQFAIQHKMELDATSNPQGDTAHFASETLFPKMYFPDIAITVSIGDMSCYDTTLTFDAHPVFGDITGDAVVDVDDLLAVINNWGPCDDSPPRVPCNADVSPAFLGSGAVDVDDLLMVINNWG